MEARPLPFFALVVLAGYLGTLAALTAFALHKLLLARALVRRSGGAGVSPARILGGPDPPTVLVQLPVFDEPRVVERAIRAAVALEWPPERLVVQILDDSDDDTPEIVARAIDRLRSEARDAGKVFPRVEHVRRGSRDGYKAGALAHGLALEPDAEFVAIFDADFVPPTDFLLGTVGPLLADPGPAMVQARWRWLNEFDSLATRVQALALDAHFVVEHGARSRAGHWFNFNGTAGVWRRAAIVEAGGWSGDTLTEDLDLSYRAQLAGARFLYLPEPSAPCELPASIAAFRSQQRRWAKGGAQTARKLFGAAIRSPRATAAARIDAAFHLCGPLVWPLLLALGLLLAPVAALREFHRVPLLFHPELATLFLGTWALAAVCGTARVSLGRSPGEALALVPALVALATGMSANNAAAAVSGLFARGGEFVRTPKRGGALGPDLPPRGASGVRPGLPFVETALAVHFAALVAWLASRSLYAAIPFPAFYAAGFGWVATLGFAERFAAATPPD